MQIPNIKSHLNDELLFLIACCQIEPSEDDIEFIYSILNYSQLDTKSLLNFATQHGILPLVYKTLKKLQINVQEHFLKELKLSYTQIAKKNILMSAKLIHIMKLLKDNNIKVLTFKGPVLAQMAHGDITLRQYSDLDILVGENDAFKVGKLMLENGHKANLPLSILSNKICLHSAKDFSFISESSGVHTELHWRLFEKKYNISILSCTLETKYQTVTINNNELQTLQNEPLLVYLCLHGAKHAFERIEWICDIDRLIRNVEINWEEAISIAKQSHSKRSFYLGLSLIHYLLHTKLPEKIMKNIDTDDIKILHIITLNQLLNKKEERSDFEKNREIFFYQAKLFDYKSDMLRFYLSTFFKISTSDCQTFILPEKLKFLYILLRPIRLVTNYSKRLFHNASSTR